MKLRSLKGKLGVGIILSAVVVLTACGTKTDKEPGTDTDTSSQKDSVQEAESETSDTGIVFGEFKAQTLEGEEVTWEIFGEEKLTMVNIWGTFCGPCIREMPDLGELNQEYADKGFQIIGIISDVTEPNNEDALEIIETTKADYTHIIASGDIKSGILSQIQVVPTTIFVDENGMQVGEVYFGAKEKEEWLLIIEQLLGEVE